MNAIEIPARKFRRLIDYLQTIGVDAEQVAGRAGLQAECLLALPGERLLSASSYSRLYSEAVVEMQALRRPLPWGAGIGGDFFEMMCHYLISCDTLGEALQRAQKFQARVFPLARNQIELSADNALASIRYTIDLEYTDEVMVPQGWDRADTYRTVAQASGLTVWHAFCGWLIGRSIDATRVTIAESAIGERYTRGLVEVMNCPVAFDAETTQLIFPREFLDFRLVHTPESLSDFLGNAVYQLIAIEKKPSSTSAAIKSLVGIDFKNGMPTFSEIAQRIHMSESSLRRRLLIEKTSYQTLKDELRCATAIEYLRNSDMKINDLSDLLGYTEPSSFVRSFRNWVGMTPKTYREQQRRPSP